MEMVIRLAWARISLTISVDKCMRYAAISRPAGWNDEHVLRDVGKNRVTFLAGKCPSVVNADTMIPSAHHRGGVGGERLLMREAISVPLGKFSYPGVSRMGMTFGPGRLGCVL